MNIIIAVAVMFVATILAFLLRQRFRQQKLLYLRQRLRPSSSNSLYGDISLKFSYLIQKQLYQRFSSPTAISY